VAHIEDRHKRDGRQKGLRWRVRYIGPDGKEHSKSFRTKQEAEHFKDTTAADVRRGTYLDPDAGKITLRAFAADWQKMQTSDVTTREAVDQRLRVHVLPVLGDRTLSELAARPGIIQAWIAGLPLAPSYVRVVTGTLSAVLNAAVADGLIPRNPCQSPAIRRPKVVARRVEPWTAEQVDAVREDMPERCQVLCDLGSGLGLRQGECFGFSPDDVEWLRPGGAVAHVRRQVRVVGGKLVFAPPKGGRERDVPVAESMKLALSAHLEHFPARPVTLPWREPGGSRSRSC
jgi:integrase